jgi:HK97 family phage major capsid protein
MSHFNMLDKASDQRRASVARDLAAYYANELAQEKPKERFSLLKCLDQMATGTFTSGSSWESTVSEAATRAQGGAPQPHQAIIPWAVFTQYQRGLTAAAPSAGGNLIGGKTGTALDALRPYSVAARMGITSVENQAQNMFVPTVTNPIAGQWLADEASAITSNTPVLGGITSKPKTAGAMLGATYLFMKQSSQSESFMRQQLLSAMGALLDSAILNGSGSVGQPLGLLNVSGVTEQTGTSFDYAEATDILANLGNSKTDDEKIRFLTTPNVRRILQAREAFAGSGIPIWTNEGQILGKAANVTSDCPAGTMFAGDWSQCQTVFWGTGMTVEVDPYTSFKTGAVQMRVLMHVDVNFLKPQAFVRCSSIT